MREMKGIVATTHRDLHGDVITREALEDAAEQAAQRCIPVLYEHDPRFPPVGRTRKAEVVELPDGHHGLFTVSEIFEPGDVAPPLNGGPSIELSELADGITLIVDRSYLDESNREILSELAAQGVTIRGQGKKSVDPISVLAVAFSLVAAGFLSKAGADLWDWVRDAGWPAVWTRVRKLLSSRRRTGSEFLFMVELRLRDDPHALELSVILDSPSEEDLDDFMLNGEPQIRAMIPQLLALGDEIIKAVVQYKRGELRGGYVIRRDGWPGRLERIDPENDGGMRSS